MASTPLHIEKLRKQQELIRENQQRKARSSIQSGNFLNSKQLEVGEFMKRSSFHSSSTKNSQINSIKQQNSNTRSLTPNTASHFSAYLLPLVSGESNSVMNLTKDAYNNVYDTREAKECKVKSIKCEANKQKSPVIRLESVDTDEELNIEASQKHNNIKNHAKSLHNQTNSESSDDEIKSDDDDSDEQSDDSHSVTVLTQNLISPEAEEEKIRTENVSSDVCFEDETQPDNDEEVIQMTKMQYSDEIIKSLPINPSSYPSRFLFEVPPENIRVYCCIRRDNNSKWPTYFMYWERASSDRIFLLAARRRKTLASKTKIFEYVFSNDPIKIHTSSLSSTNQSEKNPFIGGLKSNFLGNHFRLFCKSFVNPSKNICMAETLFETNFLGIKGPRKFNIILPGFSENNITSENRLEFPISTLDDYSHHKDHGEQGQKPFNTSNLIERWKNGQSDRSLAFENKKPKLNLKTKKYVLNFENRVHRASVKNFQLVKAEQTDKDDQTILQFGKVNDSQFSLDYSSPFCAFQAFGVALTMFGRKLAAE